MRGVGCGGCERSVLGGLADGVGEAGSGWRTFGELGCRGACELCVGGVGRCGGVRTGGCDTERLGNDMSV